MSLSRFEETLLQGGVRDAPSPERRRAARAAALRAAGVSALAASATLTTSTSAAGAGAKTAATVAPAAVKLLTLTKLLIIAVIGAGAVTAAVVRSSSPVAPIASTTPSAEIVTAVPPPPASSISSLPSASADLSEIPVVSVSAVPPATIALQPPERLSKPAPLAAAEDEVGVEAKMLHTARRCLAAGDHACARARLTEHDGRFGRKGALADEAALLAIDVALAEGRTDEARRLARAAVSQRPQGPFPARVRKLADEPGD